MAEIILEIFVEYFEKFTAIRDMVSFTGRCAYYLPVTVSKTHFKPKADRNIWSVTRKKEHDHILFTRVFFNNTPGPFVRFLLGSISQNPFPPAAVHAYPY